MVLKLIKFATAIILLFVFVILTCKNNTFLTYRQVKMSLINGKVKMFVERMSDRNGVYLMENDRNTLYFMLSRLARDSKHTAYITNLEVKPVGDALTISYDETNSKSMYGKRFDKSLLYRIKLHKNFKEIKVFKNGKETDFENVYL